VLVRRDAGRAARESALAVEEIGSVRELSARLKARFGEIPSPVGLEMDILPVAQLERIKSLLPGVAFGDASRAVMLTRAVKSAAEVAAIRQAAETVAAAVETVAVHLKPGVTELELAARLECELRLRGHGGINRMRGFNQEMFFGHVIAGASAGTVSFPDAPTGGRGLGPALAQGSSRRVIEPGEPVIVDLVGNYQGYMSDQTRLFGLERLDEPWPAMFEAAVAVQQAVVAEARPGVAASRLYDVALQAASQTPFGRSFLGEKHRVSFVGHGIGLEVDEYPFLARGFDLPLAEGMVFALEPKFILEGRGVAGIEDTYAVTASGVERLTPSPQTLRVVGGG
jgi:Xaa-Pro aminopeptidase